MRAIKLTSCPVDEIQREGNPDRGVRQPGPPFGGIDGFTLSESSLLRLPFVDSFSNSMFFLDSRHEAGVRWGRQSLGCQSAGLIPRTRAFLSRSFLNSVQIRRCQMSLAMILRIDPSHFSYEESLAMQHAERRWVEVGKPANRRRLAGLLCSVIDDCDSSGLQFPPIFLERLRALRRSSW